jgi:two-component system CheB/CheR fusion protein
MKPKSIVGIGASAGGLDALKNFFKNVPEKSGISFVVVQHLSPDYKSMMPELLSKVTNLPIAKATEGIKLEENHIYLIPAANNIIIENGALQFIKRAPSNKLNLSIDIFFNSLAKEQKEKAIGIILSGTGSDGSRGGKSIKENGGTIFVQDPVNLQFSGMPNNAIITGIADFVLPVEEIPEELTNYIEFNQSQLKAFENKHAEYYDKIVALIHEHVGIDYSLYRPQTLNRRLIRRIDYKGAENLEEYFKLIEEDEGELHELAHEFLIGVTEFFRDEEHLQAVDEKVIPQLFNNSQSGQIKLWSIACSTGEEVYSLAILLQEYIENNNLGEQNNFKIFATDINKYALDVASKGVYSKVAVKDIPQNYLTKYFTHKGDSYTILPSIRKKVIFSYHNILSNPPFSKMDLVVCRNMLIYLKTDAQQIVFKNITYALNTNGYLFLGGSEHIGRLESYYQTVDKRAKIYQKVKDSVELGSSWIARGDQWDNRRTKRSIENLDAITDESIRSLTKITKSLCIIVNSNLDIVRLYGDFNKFASFPVGGFDLQNLKLINLLPPEFSIPIASAVSKISPKDTEPITKTFSFDYEDELHFAKLSISNLSSKKIRQRLFIINILEIDDKTKKGDGDVISTKGVKKEEYQYLQQTLTDTRENLQMTIEELEASNEEAQATNEELVSSNEELQSTNEELQSVNEELNTVNVELEERNVELLVLNDDFSNLIKSSGAMNIFISDKLTIKNFTSEENPVFSFIKSDIGRNIKDLSLPDSDLIKDIKEVLKDLQLKHKEIQTHSGQWFIQTIQPYRNTDKSVSGVVVNYTEVTELKIKNEFINNVLQTVPGVIYIYDLVTNKNVYVNEASSTLMGQTEEDLQELGEEVLDQVIHPDDLPKAMAHHAEIKKLKKDKVSAVVYRLLTNPEKGTDEYEWFISYDLPIERNKRGTVTKICGIAINIDTFHRAQLALGEQTKVLEKIKEYSPSYVVIYDYNNEESILQDEQLLEYLNIKKQKGIISNHELFEPYLDKVSFNLLDIAVSDILNQKTKEFSKDFKLSNSKGETCNVNIRISAFDEIKDKKVASLIFFITDITKISELQANKRKLEQANKDLEEFAFVTSHDLKQPLRTIKGSLEILRKEVKEVQNENLTGILTMIDSTVTNMNQSLDAILDYAKLDSANELELVSIDDAAQQVLIDLKDDISKSGAMITVNAKHKVLADSNLLRLLIQNLVSNAIKFVKEGENSRVQIRSKKSKGNIILSVKDNGIGISKTKLDRIFLLFQKLNSPTKYKGSGIGLAHVKKIMKVHNGTVDVYSKIGEGSEFICTFPSESH